MVNCRRCGAEENKIAVFESGDTQCMICNNEEECNTIEDSKDMTP